MMVVHLLQSTVTAVTDGSLSNHVTTSVMTDGYQSA